MAIQNILKSKKFYAYLALMLLLCFSLMIIWFLNLDTEMKERLESKRVLSPTTYYTAPQYFLTKMKIDPAKLKNAFHLLKFRERLAEEKIFEGDFKILNYESCLSEITVELPEAFSSCVLWQNHHDNFFQAMVLDSEQQILSLLKGLPWLTVDQTELEVSEFAQYIDDEPIFQNLTALGNIPPTCLNAIMAVEDKQFLSHMGVNPKGIMRALLVNLTTGRASQGGSTITQQTVKNYYLTSEKTLKRKLKEFAMSLILEARATKDDIFETYLNIIYMGQSGPFQIRGYGAAAEYYFGKTISELNLAECSLLAAVINSPGLYNPFKKQENATKRRNMVLQLMLDQNFITQDEKEQAEHAALPSQHTINLSETAPYFIDAVKKQALAEGISLEEKNIYTTLDLAAQSAAQAAVQNHLKFLETNNTLIKKNKENKLQLEAMFISAQPKNGWITAAIGGRNFKMTQYNRVTDAHRQIGSIMKPIVYLTALGQVDSNGDPYTPRTLLKDEKFTYKYEGQEWTPQNYDKKFAGDVPMHFALKNSLNVSTARIATDVGLDKIIDTARSLGIQSQFKKVPSLALGTFELYPMEVLEAYTTFANMGAHKKLTFIREIQDANQNILWKFTPEVKQVVEFENTAVLVGMMKQTMISGTAQSAFAKGFTVPSAGKTGTTSDYKDSWFAGFTPYQVAISWVGYDNNTSHKLTGSTGALPIWLEFMKSYSTQFPPDDFTWPENTEAQEVEEGISLIFKK